MRLLLELVGGENDGEQIERVVAGLDQVPGVLLRMPRDGMPLQVVPVDPEAGLLLQHERYELTEASKAHARKLFAAPVTAHLMSSPPVLRYAFVRDTPSD